MAPTLGVALSGGGFRAAFFHVGVLARMAELGMLRNVEVISAVSGGSIVGALYYIRLKELLETVPDGAITDEQYRRLVVEVEALLRSAVRENIRARIFLNPWKNVAMASGGYSRSHRIGDLYDRYIYKPAWPAEREHRSLGREKQIRLRELVVHPLDAGGERVEVFKPDEDNGGRIDKVPILLINATSLNTGHAWRFEAVRMGEPLPADPALSDLVRDIDKNMRLEQGYFLPQSRPPRAAYAGGAPRQARQFEDPDLQAFPLGIAVAASACVPGVFQPVTIRGAYEGIDVQLVDGGVHDNQGVQGLLDVGCTHLVISDGSGQMRDEEKPATRIPAVVERSMTIPRDSVRDEQLVRAALPPRQLALMHLRKGLDGRVVAPDEALAGAETEREGGLDTTDFGVDARVQDALSKIRTDLDFFSDVEASSLELDGYRMTTHVLEQGGDGWSEVAGGGGRARPAVSWRFDDVDHLIGTEYEPYLRRLVAGASSFFRPLHRLRHLRWVKVGAAIVAVAAIVAWLVASGGDVPAWVDAAFDWDGSLAVALGLIVLAVLYLGRGRLSKAVFAVAAWIVVPILALPLFLIASLQILGRRLLNRFDRIPPGP